MAVCLSIYPEDLPKGYKLFLIAISGAAYRVSDTRLLLI